MPSPVQTGAAKRKAATQIVTANRLADGAVVYLDGSGGWTVAIDAAALLDGDDEIAAGLASGAKAVAQQLIVEPYAIDVVKEGDTVRPLRLREAIRARGPSTREDLAIQPADPHPVAA